MRNLKRVLSLALALVMVLGMMVITTSAATYADAEEITEVEAVEVLSALGIVSGDGTNFNPNGTFTRRDAAKLIAYMLGYGKTAEKLNAEGLFSDVAADHWSAGYIAFCASRGYISGLGNGTFNPKGTLTDIELGKLVLCALGYEPTKYTGPNWAANVTVDMMEAGLVASVTGKAITRENACDMILAGMKKGVESVSYLVEVNGQPIHFATQSDALMFSAIKDGSEYVGEVVTISDSLLETVYNVKPGTSTDAFGRATIEYTNKTTGKAVVTLPAAEAAYVYTKAVKADDLAAELKGLEAGVYEIGEDVKAAATVKGLVQTNGAKGNLTIDAGKALEDAIAALTDDHKTVEIYVANGVISNIVVVETFYGKVTDVVEADAKKEIKASIEIAGEYNVETTGYEKGDWVAYTKVGTKVKSVAKLDSFTAQLTKYTAKGEYTIGGEVYEVVARIEAAVKSSIGKDMVYFVGNNGILVAVEATKDAPEAKVTDYLKVLNSAAAWVPTGSLLETTYALATEVEVLLPDGTTATYALALTTKNGATTIGKLGTAASVANVEALKGGFYTYTVADGVLTLVAAQDVKAVNDPSVPVIAGDYIINSDTSIILRVTDKKDSTKWTYKVVKGLTAAEKSEVTGSAVVSVIKDAEGNVTAKVVDVIFADACEFVPNQAAVEGTETYVYYDGTYEVAYDAVKKVEVYTGVVTKIDGTTAELVVAGTEGAGVFELQSDNTLKADGTKATVNVIAGDMYNLSGEYVTVNDTTKVLVVAQKAALEKGAEVVYFAKDGVATQIFVVKAAPKA